MTLLRVLFVAGEGRSGSTLLGRMLDEHEGVFAAGEMRYLWSRGLLDEEHCQCGRTFTDCVFWDEVLSSGYGDGGRPVATKVVALDHAAVRLRHLPRTLLQAWYPATTSRQFREYAGILRQLYEGVVSVSGASLVVDTSKVPAYAVVLRSIPNVDVYVVHLVRDPRGTAFSWTRRKALGGRRAATMRTHTPLVSAVQWVIWNVLAEVLLRRRGRYLSIRYEDLVQSPETTIARILSFACRAPGSEAARGRPPTTTGPGHMAWGNPDRLSERRVTLRLDDEWVRMLPVRARLVVTLVTLPLLWRYGYPVAPRRTRRSTLMGSTLMGVSQ